MATLLALEGPIEGALFQLGTEEVSIGRQASSQLCVGDLSVSRQHCIIQPAKDGFRIHDLASNNGTFVNGKRVEECILTDGDKIRIGDTVFVFSEKQDGDAEQYLALPDNGLVAHSCVQTPASESADTAIGKLLESVPQESGFATRARSLLKIGAGLNKSQGIDALATELLNQIMEVVPADQSAIVLLAHTASGEPTIVGSNRHPEQLVPVSVSRTLVSKAINDGTTIFSDDIASDQEFSHVSSLGKRSVDSVIVVPLVADRRRIGAIYLDSTSRVNLLNRDHLEFVVVVAEFAGGALEHAQRLRTLKEQNRRLESALHLKHDLIGCSSGMRQISERIAKIARTDATVLIGGETGTGKELAARAIHQNSARAAGPFEAINCSLLRDTLLESELFGHEKGSFTGAIAQKRGKLELAAGGTLFLDEVAELGASPQAMLLRVLQTREFRRLGGDRTIHVDIRIIAATNKNLEEAIQDKTFRQDLYYRLNVVSLTMPPLRERREDIPLLADHFIQICSRKNKRLVKALSAEASSVLTRYDWAGNVRELENAIEHAVVFGATDEILPEDLPDLLLRSHTTSGDAALGYHDAVRESKRKIVLSAIDRASGAYSQAARLLGIHVNTLHRLIRELEIKSILASAAHQRSIE
jgi:Nif-specific regulatory protein